MLAAVISLLFSVPFTVTSLKVTLLVGANACGKSIVIVLLVTVVSTPTPPVTVSVSVNKLTVSVPALPAMLKLVATLTVPAAVSLPLLSTVNVGIAVALP